MKRNVNLPERIDCLISEFSCFKIGYTQIYAHNKNNKFSAGADNSRYFKTTGILKY